ncbi:MAG: Uma2 family endonuclease [Hormoscilla sp. GUM202]|nr:Uma2 family endonuclease [Hormoscilla sp. GUM202]
MVGSTVDVNISQKTLSFAEYLEYSGEPGVLYELDRGQLLEMPTTTGLHNLICKILTVEFLRHLVSENLNLVAIDLTGVRTEENTSRIPDVVVCHQSFWKKVCERKGAAVLNFDEKPLLVVEVTSQNWRDDYSTKRAEYDRLDIPEYWIVDPERSRVRLCSKIAGGSSYAERDFLPGDEVKSAQFPGLILPVARILDPPDVDYLVREELRLRQELAQLERQLNAERQRAEAADRRAEAADRRAEAADRRAEAERQRAEQLAQYLQALGIDPDTIN